MPSNTYVKILKYSTYEDLNTIPEHQTKESIENDIINYWLSEEPVEVGYITKLSSDTIAYALKLTGVMSHLTHHWPLVYPVYEGKSMMLDYHFRDNQRGHLVLLVNSKGEITVIFGDSDVTGKNHDVQKFNDLEQMRESDWLRSILDAKQNLICQQRIHYHFKSYASEVFTLIDQVNKINKKYNPEIFMDHDNAVNFDLRIPGSDSVGDHFESSVFLEDGNLIHDGHITRHTYEGGLEFLAIYEHIPSALFIDLVTNGFDNSREESISKVLA